MQEDTFVAYVLASVVLLLIVALASMFFKKIHFSYTIGLVIVGMVVGFSARFTPLLDVDIATLPLFTTVVFYMLLPSLIFEAAINIDARLLMKNVKPVLALAIPGLIISMLFIGVVMTLLTPLNLGSALLFGALISATDPVAVIQIFREIGAPKRLTMLVDGESFFNDATAIVAFDIVKVMILTGLGVWSSFSLVSWGATFLFVFFGGIAVGLVLAYLVVLLLNMSKRDPLIQITLTTFVAYLAFIVANYYLHVSGVMAVLVAGIVINWYVITRMKVEFRNYMHQFWSYVTFLANSVLFILLGVTEYRFIAFGSHPPHLLRYIAIAIAAVLIARAIIVYLMMPMITKISRDKPISSNFRHVIFWGGIRGAVPLALVFSIPATFDHRHLIVSFTLSVVLFTLLVQGISLSKLIHFLTLDRRTLLDEANEVEVVLSMKERAYEHLSTLAGEYCFSEAFIVDIMRSYEHDIAALKIEMGDIVSKKEFSELSMRKVFWKAAMITEREVYKDLFQSGFIAESVLQELILSIELSGDSLKSGELPELFSIHMPFEMKVKSAAARLAHRLFSHYSFIMRVIQQAYITKYEISLAMIIACNHIRPVIERLALLYDAPDDVISSCVNFYMQRQDRARRYIASLAEEDVPATFQLEKMRLVAASVEYDSVHDLIEKGGVYAKNASIINEKIEASIDRYKKNIEDLYL